MIFGIGALGIKAKISKMVETRLNIQKAIAGKRAVSTTPN
jgi:hypothetical protein